MVNRQQQQADALDVLGLLYPRISIWVEVEADDHPDIGQWVRVGIMAPVNQSIFVEGFSSWSIGTKPTDPDWVSWSLLNELLPEAAQQCYRRTRSFSRARRQALRKRLRRLLRSVHQAAAEQAVTPPTLRLYEDQSDACTTLSGQDGTAGVHSS